MTAEIDDARALLSAPEPPDPATAALAFALIDRAEGRFASADSEPDLAACRDHLAGMRAAATRETEGAQTAEEARAALAGVIAKDLGYFGDAERYEAPENADLISVIRRRRGLPVALGALYASAARESGFTVRGLGFPGHFLMRIDHGGGRAVFDPFASGAAMEAHDLRALAKAALGEAAELKPEFLAPVDDRRIVIRLRNNVKVRLLRAGALREAAEVAEGMVAFAPDEVELLREIGLIRARLGEIMAARAALDAYLARAADESGRRRARQLLDELERRLQ